MKIKAAVVQEQCGLLIEEVELDEPRDDEVLVRIVRTGLCHTDLGSKAGKRPTLHRPRPRSARRWQQGSEKFNLATT